MLVLTLNVDQFWLRPRWLQKFVPVCRVYSEKIKFERKKKITSIEFLGSTHNCYPNGSLSGPPEVCLVPQIREAWLVNFWWRVGEESQLTGIYSECKFFFLSLAIQKKCLALLFAPPGSCLNIPMCANSTKKKEKKKRLCFPGCFIQLSRCCCCCCCLAPPVFCLCCSWTVNSEPGDHWNWKSGTITWPFFHRAENARTLSFLCLFNGLPSMRVP